MRVRPVLLAVTAAVTTAASLVVAPVAGAAPVPAAHAATRTPSWLPKTPSDWPLVVDEDRAKPETLTRGVQHWSDHLDTVSGAQRAQVLDVDLTDPNVRLGVVEAGDHLTAPDDEVPSSMANRTGAVAGINGDFFEIYSTGRPTGMVVVDGRLEKSPRADRPWNVWVRKNGTVGIGPQTYTGTVTDGGASHALTSVNTVDDLKAGGLVRLTPFLGTPSPIASSTLVTGTRDGADLVVTKVEDGVTDVPQLAKGTEALAGAGDSASWLDANVHAGDHVRVAEQLGPDGDVQQAVGGGARLVQDGKRAVPLQGDGDNNVNNPVTAVGVTRDGRHVIMAAFDGHQPEGVAQGLTRPQLAGWLLAHGAYQGLLMDSGGSTQMVGREPGDRKVSVLNVPSDGHERPVANGLFVYSTAKAAGPARSVTVNGNRPLTLLDGTTADVPAYARDRFGNPATDGVHLAVHPPSLASVSGTKVTARRPGAGTLVATAGGVRKAIPLRIAASLDTLTIAPETVDLQNGDTQAFTASATAGKQPVLLPPDQIRWSADPSSLGTIAADGTFTAAKTGSALGTVRAAAGGRTAKASVAVGQETKDLDPLTDAGTWGVSDQYMNVYPRKVPNPGPHQTSVGSLSTSDESPPGLSGGSFQVHYDFPEAAKTYDLDVYLNDPESEQATVQDGKAPTGIGLWVKGNEDLASRPGQALQPGILSLNVGIWQSTNQPTSVYPTGVTFDGWQYVVAKLPPGLQYPLRFNYLALVVIKPDRHLTGDVKFAGLQVLYSPRPPVTKPYDPIPDDNPAWLRFGDVDRFRAGGTTLAAMDDAHVRANTPDGTGPAVMKRIASDFGGLPARARPERVQALGDMPDSGTTENLTYAKSLLDGLGVPYRDAVGNHEITQGADPENGNYASVFGDTRYAYRAGPANVIVSDSSHIGINASDAFQRPALAPENDSQYRWLAAQLDRNRARTAFVVTHTPAYDPHPRADSQFSDRWEAHMYERLVVKYRKSHPRVHVLMLFGHARGFAENVLDEYGADQRGGTPNFVVADAGSPPYAPTDQGGFYHYALFHALPDGTVQFAVQPVLASVAVSAPAGTSLARGAHERLTATGTSVTGTDADALSVPIQDPVSRSWTTSDPRVATVDRTTGLVTAHRAGKVTVTVKTGGVTGEVDLTVTT